MAQPVLDNSNAWVEQFNSAFSITFNTTGTGKLLFLHVNAFFGNTDLPTITGTTLTWTKLVDVGTPSAAYSGVYWAVTSGALTGEVATATFTGSCAIALQVDEWSGATDYSGLTEGTDYGVGSVVTDASVTSTPNANVTTYAADSHVRGMVGGFIGEAWGAGTNTTAVTTSADVATLERSDNPQTSTGTFTVTGSNGSGNTDDWRGIALVAYEVLGIGGGGGGTEYTQAVAGSLTLSSSLATAVAYTLLVQGTLSLAGSILKKITKTFLGSITPLNILSKTISTTRTGSLTPSGSIDTGSSLKVVLAGSITLAGGLLKAISAVLIGSLVLSGGIFKKLRRTLGGSLVLTGDITRKFFRTLVGSLVVSGVVTTTTVITKLVSGVLTLASTLVGNYIPWVPKVRSLIANNNFIRRFIGRR